MKLFRKYRDGGEELVDALVQAGIDTVYSIPGAQLLSVWDAIGRRNDIQLIVPRSEWEGVELAIKYFQKNGKPAVVMNTVGPGVVNELPALFQAQLHKATVICISPAQPEYKRRRIDRVFQGLNDNEILFPMTRSRHILKLSDVCDAVRQRCNLEWPIGLTIEFDLLFSFKVSRC